MLLHLIAAYCTDVAAFSLFYSFFPRLSQGITHLSIGSSLGHLELDAFLDKQRFSRPALIGTVMLLNHFCDG
jgi:hypothetical protein